MSTLDASIEALLPATTDFAIRMATMARAMMQRRFDQDYESRQERPPAGSVYHSFVPRSGPRTVLAAPEQMIAGTFLPRATAAALLDWAGSEDSTVISLYLIEHGTLPPFEVRFVNVMDLVREEPVKPQPGYHGLIPWDKRQWIYTGVSRHSEIQLDLDFLAQTFPNGKGRQTFEEKCSLLDDSQVLAFHAGARLTLLGVLPLTVVGESTPFSYTAVLGLPESMHPGFRHHLWGKSWPRWEPVTGLLDASLGPVPIEEAFYQPKGVGPVDLRLFLR